MKVKDKDIVRRFHADPDAVRLTLLCGPNITRCQALVDELTAPLAGTAERVDLSISDLSDNPARLNDEANSTSLFGDRRYIVLRLNSGEAVRAAAAIEILLDSETTGDPVFVVAPGMADKTALAKKIAAAPGALIATCYESSQADAIGAIVTLAKQEGLLLSRNMARDIADLASNDLVLARLEVEKIALYLDATTAQPAEPPAAILAQLGAENEEEDLGALINAALCGDTKAVTSELAGLGAAGLSEIGLVRLMLRHLSKLAELRGKADNGGGIEKIVNHPSVFWKDRKNFARQMGIWSSANVSRLVERILSLEITMKSSGQAEHVLLEQELLTISRKAAQLR